MRSSPRSSPARSHGWKTAGEEVEERRLALLLSTPLPLASAVVEHLLSFVDVPIELDIVQVVEQEMPRAPCARLGGSCTATVPAHPNLSQRPIRGPPDTPDTPDTPDKISGIPDTPDTLDTG
jgi:hypothetical protein